MTALMTAVTTVMKRTAVRIAFQQLLLYFAHITLCSLGAAWFPGGGTSCIFYEFICDNGACVPTYFRCDGVDDCGDGSDEENCELLLFVSLCLNFDGKLLH